MQQAQRKKARKLYSINRVKTLRRKDRVKVNYRRLARRRALDALVGTKGKA